MRSKYNIKVILRVLRTYSVDTTGTFKPTLTDATDSNCLSNILKFGLVMKLHIIKVYLPP